MNNNSESHIFATSIKCAATIITLGARIRSVDSVTITIESTGREDCRFWFQKETATGGEASDLIAAYSFISRGGIKNGVAKPSKEAALIINNGKHPLYTCFHVLQERDRLHGLVLDARKRTAKAFSPYGNITNNTKLAAILTASGHKEKEVLWDGVSVWFVFEDKAEVQDIRNTFEAAWGIMLKDPQHPIYFMKSVLDRREELFALKNHGVNKDGDVARSIYNSRQKPEPFIIERQGSKTILTPVNITDENRKKSQQYL